MRKILALFFAITMLVATPIEANANEKLEVVESASVVERGANNNSKTIPNENTKTDIPKNNFHIKLSQSVFSDETSKNYYFTILYIGENKKRQKYLIDTSSGIMSSTCFLVISCK